MWGKLFTGVKKASIFLCLTLTLLFIFSSTAQRRVSASKASPSVVFSNPTPIAINTYTLPTPAATYPSTINVSGMTGNTTKVTLTLTGINHENLSDLDFLLVSPTGTKFIPLSDVGGTFPTTNLNLLLDDAAAGIISGNPPSGTYRPTNYSFPEGDLFPAPAPGPPYNNPAPTSGFTFTVFNGADPNGTWSLFITDDTITKSGNISGGWSLSITTSGSPATAFSNSANIAINDVAVNGSPATPYPSAIDVTGLSGVVSSLTVTLNNVSHGRSRDIDVLLVSPNGTAFILMSDAGSSSANNVTLTFDDNSTVSLPQSDFLASGTFRPTDYIAESDTFPNPAPFPPYLIPLGQTPLKSAFGNFAPNGAWKLYVTDDTSAINGSIAGGWSLDITTAPYVAPVIGCAYPSFNSVTNYPVGSNPTGIASGDFNNDTKQDMVVANQGANNVSVLLGNGLGGFGSASNFATGTSPYSVAVAQFSNDSNLDLVVVNSGSNNVSILLGDGAGNFSAPTNFGVGLNPIWVATGDFNNDTKVDLAVANFGGFFAGTVSVLIGTGTGTFGPATSFGVRTQPSFVAVSDFNGDNNQDLAVSNFGSNNTSILLGTGTGAFTSAPLVAVGSGPVSIAIADYNNDSKSDLAVVSYNQDLVSIHFGTGSGTFGGGPLLSGGTNPISIVAADFSSDGKPDLAVAGSSSNSVSVLFNDGQGNFGLGVGLSNIGVGTGPNTLVVADFNGDGRPDVATVNSNSNNVSVLLNTCAIAKGKRLDFDADRRTDFSVWRPSTGIWYILNSSTNNTNYSSPQLGVSSDILVPEDYNGDGKTDIGVFRPGTATWIVPGIYFIEFGLATDIPVPADFDGDGRADLAVFRPSDGTWYIRRSIDNMWLSIPFGTSGDKPIPRDFDGDGKADVTVFRPSTGSWYVLRSSDGQFYGQPFGISTDRPVAGDYDGDGKADIAVWRPSDGGWYILRSSDNSFFGQSWGVATDIPVPGDYDGDGKFDIAVWRPSEGYWYVSRSSNGAIQLQSWGVSTDIPVPSTTIP